MDRIHIAKILPDATTTATGESHSPIAANCNFQATGETSAGVGAATIVIEGHNLASDESDIVWETIDTLSLTLGTATTSDSGASTAPWNIVRARVSAISGTDATVRVYMAVER